jgi:hypothetical protein
MKFRIQVVRVADDGAEPVVHGTPSPDRIINRY